MTPSAHEPAHVALSPAQLLPMGNDDLEPATARQRPWSDAVACESTDSPVSLGDTGSMIDNELEVALRRAPHLRPYVEDGDVGLDAARDRWTSAQGRISARLRRDGVEVKTRQTVRGLVTTAVRAEPRIEDTTQ